MPAAWCPSRPLSTASPIDPGENSYPNYLDYAASTRTMSSLLAFSSPGPGGRFTAAMKGGTYELRGMLVTPNFFQTLGVRLVRGREFTAEEARGAAPLAAIIAWHVWQNQFHGAEDTIGQPVTLNGHTATIVGIGPPKFTGIWFAPHFEVCVPLEAYVRLAGHGRTIRRPLLAACGMIGRLAPGSSLDEARAEFAAIAARLAEASGPKPTAGQASARRAAMAANWRALRRAKILAPAGRSCRHAARSGRRIVRRGQRGGRRLPSARRLRNAARTRCRGEFRKGRCPRWWPCSRSA